MTMNQFKTLVSIKHKWESFMCSKEAFLKKFLENLINQEERLLSKLSRVPIIRVKSKIRNEFHPNSATNFFKFLFSKWFVFQEKIYKKQMLPMEIVILSELENHSVDNLLLLIDVSDIPAIHIPTILSLITLILIPQKPMIDNKGFDSKDVEFEMISNYFNNLTKIEDSFKKFNDFNGYLTKLDFKEQCLITKEYLEVLNLEVYFLLRDLNLHWKSVLF
jgi:hypothetical protein